MNSFCLLHSLRLSGIILPKGLFQPNSAGEITGWILRDDVNIIKRRVVRSALSIGEAAKHGRKRLWRRGTVAKFINSATFLFTSVLLS
jgi:hypothetical protein